MCKNIEKVFQATYSWDMGVQHVITTTAFVFRASVPRVQTELLITYHFLL